MPLTLTIPARTETHCCPCEFHKLTGALHVRIGPGGWREYHCTHPDAYEFQKDGTPIDPKLIALQKEIDGIMQKEGRLIGRTEIQPAWCPLLRKANP